MPSFSGQKTEVVIARNKRTGEKYLVRVVHLKGRRDFQIPYLHFTDQSRTQVCRCLKVNDHGKSALAVDHDDKNIAMRIMRYLKSFGIESCQLSDYYQYREQQKIQWGIKGVYPERFHYLTKEKDAVCRCSAVAHHTHKRVSNAIIQDLSAEFFAVNATKNVCTREEWRMQDSLNPQANTQRVSLPTPLRKGSFEFDTPSFQQLLQDREARSLESRMNASCSPSGKIASASRPDSSNSDHRAYLCSGPNGEADIPESLWRVSRPSLYLGQEDYESTLSTPIGSAATMGQSEVHLDAFQRLERRSSLMVGAEAPGLGHYSVDLDDVAYTGLKNNNFDTAELGISSRGTLSSPTSSSSTTPSLKLAAAELPSSETIVELHAKSLLSEPSHHSPTLRQLEHNSFDYVAELAGRVHTESKLSSPRPAQRQLPHLRMSHRVLSLSKLPCQEDFLLKWAEPCSRTCPAPAEDCSLCHNSFQTPNKHTIRLTCGHYIHQECLVANFRVLDFEFGNCPVCGMAVCERKLRDRIDTDREAIFGKSFTNLISEERIEFAQHSQSVVCWSEEEIAAAQLRLLKDYIDSHADELYREWRETGYKGEPDWHGAVVVPVVSLFKGWNVQKRKCKYFADRDAFYKLVVWAELVRLVNTIRDGVKQVLGEDTPFPQLNELHRKFMRAKDRYETEKKTWQTNRLGVLECEKVAQDAFSLAVSTHMLIL